MNINKNKFKKAIIVSIIGVILSFLTFVDFKASYLENLGWAFFWVIPILTGVFITVIQKEDRVMDILPSLAAGSFAYSVLLIFIFKLYIFVNERIGYTTLYSYLKPFRGWDDIMVHAALFGIVLSGGLIGIAIMGVNEKLLKRGIRIRLNFPFPISFILGSIFVLASNTYYVFVQIPHDGRWKSQLPITSAFVLVYLALFSLVSWKLLKNSKYNYLPWIYNLLLAFLFLGNCGGVQQAFQYVDYLYVFHYIPVAPYLVILGAGLTVYALLLGYLENSRKFKKIVLKKKIIIPSVMVFIIFLGVAIPKVMIFTPLQDGAEKNYYAGLENAYARQQARIFFDNPFERMFIMKTAVTDMTPGARHLIVTAYTFFGFKYKTIEIERVNEEAMAQMLGRETSPKIGRAGEDAPVILDRIKAPEGWSKR